jgi:hypothetical protein
MAAYNNAFSEYGVRHRNFSSINKVSSAWGLTGKYKT